jgi:ubiquinone/menaquinone biosynthesis C-methylase UbiE
MKTGLQKIFDEVAPTYERVNRVLTLGLDRRWRKKAARIAAIHTVVK